MKKGVISLLVIFSLLLNINYVNGLGTVVDSRCDGNNLYYAGLRTDGQAVIKKKQNGVYYTLALQKVLDGTYNRETNPNLIPKEKWMGLRSEIYSYKGEVYINLYLDKNNDGTYILLTQAHDYKKSQGTPIDKSGYTGIRADFMDVEFDNYKLVNL